jgi:hypothetical protein
MSSRLVCTLFLSLVAGRTFAQADQILPPMGGPGGGQFFARCAPGDLLTGVDLRVGDDVDGIRPVCASVRAPTFEGNRRVYAKGFGGTGGEMARLECPDSAPAIAGLEVAYEGEETIIINNVHLFCSVALPNQALTTYPTAVFDGPVIGEGDYGVLIGGRRIPLTRNIATCPAGLVPVGITGRAGIWLDALSLICGALPYDPAPKPAPPKPEPVKSIGRVNTGTPRPNTSRSICDSARDALSRQSPAAPNLVAQCRAAGGSATAVASNADLETVMVRGEVIAANDAMAGELRNRTPEGPARRGFDIGLGIWDGNTAPGPGKQRYHDALTRPEQQGFDVAAAYALPRNKYATLINVGSVIAGADQEAAAARAVEADPFYWLGFDIASGLFGDPAAGSEGSKAIGAGAIGIRNALNAAAQRGFNASVALHLSRSYP